MCIRDRLGVIGVLLFYFAFEPQQFFYLERFLDLIAIAVAYSVLGFRLYLVNRRLEKRFSYLAVLSFAVVAANPAFFAMLMPQSVASELSPREGDLHFHLYAAITLLGIAGAAVTIKRPGAFRGMWLAVLGILGGIGWCIMYFIAYAVSQFARRSTD